MKRQGGWVRILIYVFPAMMDIVVALMLFVNATRAESLGYSNSVGTGFLVVWGSVYLAACPLVGRIVNRHNAARLMIASSMLVIAVSAVFPLVSSLPVLYVLAGLVAVAASLYFTPFQIFMKAVGQGGRKSLTWSVGLYTLAWSTGFALGPFVSGYLLKLGKAAGAAETTLVNTGFTLLRQLGNAEPSGMDLGLLMCYAFTALAGLITLVGTILLKHLAHHQDEPVGELIEEELSSPSHPDPVDYSRMPDLAWLGWISTGVGCLVVSIMRQLFPTTAQAAFQLDDAQKGVVLFVLSMSQALTGLALCWSRTWMYRGSRVLAFGLVGVAGAVLFAWGTSWGTFIAAAALFGVYAGSFFFYLVFHSLSHPKKAERYVAINEMVVGGTSVLGGLAGGMMADAIGVQSPYWMGAALVLGVTLYQVGVHRRRPIPTVDRAVGEIAE